MQVVPRVVSRAADGVSDEREFLPPYFETLGQMYGMVFLKGYQWPFDARKVIGGSSLVDILVYIETVVRGRRVYLDYRANPEGFRFEDLPADALTYLTRSGALQETPYRRLETMNPGAIELYRTNGIDLSLEALEVAVCAQHNNGGLAGNIWWGIDQPAPPFPNWRGERLTRRGSAWRRFAEFRPSGRVSGRRMDCQPLFRLDAR